MNVIVWSKDDKDHDVTVDFGGIPEKGSKVVGPDGKEHNVLEVVWYVFPLPPRVQIADIWTRG